MLKIGSLCTGYGGLDLAAEYVLDAETIWCAEFDKYASQVIEQRFGIANFGDIKTINWNTVPAIDILTAGYPCQPFSHAGQRKGTDDPRHIWPYIKEAISILRPRIIILENVRGHLSLGFKEVLKDLAEIGYDARWEIIRASDVGAPHQRARLFIVAYPNSNAHAQSRRTDSDIHGSSSEIIDGSNWHEHRGSSKTIANTNNYGFETRINSRLETTFTWPTSIAIANCNTNDECKSHNGQMQELGRRFATRCQMRMRTPPNPLDLDGKLNAVFVEYMMGLPEGWVTDIGLSRAQQLKMLGNGVVPQQAAFAITKLLSSDTPF